MTSPMTLSMMSPMMLIEPILILSMPLLAVLIILLFKNRLGEKVYPIGVLALTAGFALSLRLLYRVGLPGSVPIHLLPLSLAGGVLQFGLYVDRLSAVMMTLISGISILISLFSIRYMQQDQGRVRYHSLLLLTIFALLCMVSSDNLLMLFVFWQLLTWLLCLLSHHYAHPPTVEGAFKTYTVLRVGDIAFLSGIVLAYGVYGTLDFHQLFARSAEVQRAFSLWPGGGLSINAATAVTLLIFVGAMSKSAQFPMHFWLPGSLYAPTPVHALLHAGIINAGGFLLNRLAPLYGLGPATLHVVFAVGLLTTFLGASMMLTQNDIKKTLGHSTIGQMGYMIMECGLGAFALAIFHLIAHGLFKATVFLNCGSVIHAARQEPRLPPPADLDEEEAERVEFSRLTWGAGFVTSLILPLIILLAAHGALNIPLLDSQGAVIFLFFSWVTSSQAILSLYRLRAVASWKVAAAMLLTLLLVVVTYLLAAERFTYFLYPDPTEVGRYFQAAALPGWLFDFLVAATALFIILGWVILYAKTHGQTIRLPDWVNALQVRLYVLFMNRLYIEAFYSRLGRRFTRLLHRLDQSTLFPYLWGGIALGFAAPAVLSDTGWIGNLSAGNFALLIFAALMLPLFPLHRLYLSALTRLPGSLSIFFALLLPAAGLYALTGLLPETPPELLKAASTLALFGAIYGTLKALVQFRVRRLLAYAGIALFSILWWYLGIVGKSTPQAAVYAGAVALVTGGLLFAWHRLEARYGDLDLDRIGGLARPMPRFGLLLSLLVMAAMGLPPFGLFSGYVEMLLSPSIGLSDLSIGTMGGVTWHLAIILLAWLAASWYFFRLMQRLLFGPHRPEIVYNDFRWSEIASLLIVLLILLVVGVTPYRFLGLNPQTNRQIVNMKQNQEILQRIQTRAPEDSLASNASKRGRLHPAQPVENGKSELGFDAQ
jgi:NADH-quinone oxidoreductase subunit L